MTRKTLYYRLEPVVEPPADAGPQIATAAVVTCLATGRMLDGMGGGGEFLSVEVVDALRRGARARMEPGDTPCRLTLRGLRDTLLKARTDDDGPDRLILPSGKIIEGETATVVGELITSIIELANDALRLENVE